MTTPPPSGNPFEGMNESSFGDPATDTELGQLFKQVADMAVEGAFSAIVSDDNTVEVARRLISEGRILGAIGLVAQQAQLLGMVEDMRLPETAETAVVNAEHREARIQLLLDQGVHFTDPIVQAVVGEQQADPFQVGYVAQGINFILAQEGDGSAFATWLHVGLAEMYVSDAQMTEFEPFPPFEGWEGLVEILHMLMEQAASVERGSADVDRYGAEQTLLGYLDTIEAEFAASPRKALLAERISNLMLVVSQDATRDVRRRAHALYFKMLKEGTLDPEDRIGEHLTNSRLHKQSIMALIRLTEKPMYKPEVDKLFAEWDKQGLFDEEDHRKIGIWREKSAASAERNRRNRARRHR